MKAITNNRKLAYLGLFATLIGTAIIGYLQKDIFMAIMVFTLWMYTFLTGAKVQEVIEETSK